MRGFVQYVIIIYQNWTIYTYGYLIIKETVSNIPYKSINFCDKIFYMLNYY